MSILQKTRKLAATAVALILGIPFFVARRVESRPTTGSAQKLSASDTDMLKSLQKQGIQYFLDNQLPHGMVLDRQTNFAPLRFDRICSTSATGMGLMAIAVASDDDHKIITRAEAIRRVGNALRTTLTLPEDHGLMPHFLQPDTLKPVGTDNKSTIDSSWLIAGGLWAADYLNDPELQKLARQIYDRVDWMFWAKNMGHGEFLMDMGESDDGKQLPAWYDRFNGESAFMYMMAIGATNAPLPGSTWKELPKYLVKVKGEEIGSGDLGLFVFQYSGALIDYSKVAVKGQLDLHEQAIKAVAVNFKACRDASKLFSTYDYFWGLSAGDGPNKTPGQPDDYNGYSPTSTIDGTAHITASLASVDIRPDLVMQNVHAAESGVHPGIRGRYGYSNVNLDRKWVSSDVVGIDIGMAVMVLENKLYDGKLRKTWHGLPMVQSAVAKIEATNK